MAERLIELLTLRCACVELDRRRSLAVRSHEAKAEN